MIVCEPAEADVVKVDSCGKYTRKSDGVTGRSSATVDDEDPGGRREDREDSPGQGDLRNRRQMPRELLVGVRPPVRGPALELQMHEVTNEQVNAYAVEVSKQPLR